MPKYYVFSPKRDYDWNIQDGFDLYVVGNAISPREAIQIAIRDYYKTSYEEGRWYVTEKLAIADVIKVEGPHIEFMSSVE